MTRPSIDHGTLSPSGHVSKRSRKLALERASKELFPDGMPGVVVPQPSEREYLLRKAAELRGLADRGMHPISGRREAERLEALAKEQR